MINLSEIPLTSSVLQNTFGGPKTSFFKVKSQTKNFFSSCHVLKSIAIDNFDMCCMNSD